jgi:hypothetical protein
MTPETATLANAETPADVEPRRLLAQGAESVRQWQTQQCLDTILTECSFPLVRAQTEMSDCNAAQRIFESQLGGRPAIVKQRFSKKYRHPTLDSKLTTARLKQVPAVLAIARCYAPERSCSSPLILCAGSAVHGAGKEAGGADGGVVRCGH